MGHNLGLLTTRNLHTGFRSVPKLVALSDVV